MEKEKRCIKFLSQVKENEKVLIEAFIPQIYSMFIYFCNRCNKISEEKMCDCGNFPKPIFKISGLISDGTKTMRFKTLSEKVSEELSSGVKRNEVKNLDPKEIMSKPHTLFGYRKGNTFFVEKVSGE